MSSGTANAVTFFAGFADMILRWFLNRLPMQMRAPFRPLISRSRQRRPFQITEYRPRKAFSGTHVIVAGIYRSATGLGRAAELVALTLEQQGSIVTRVDLTAALGMPQIDQAGYPEPQDCMSIAATDCVIVLNPDGVRALALFDRQWLLDKCIIGHWIWELERLPLTWQPIADTYDEIWAPTDVLFESFKDSLRGFAGTVRLLPYAFVSDAISKPEAAIRRVTRDRFEIGPDEKIIGYSFAAASNYARKNPEAAIDAFQLAFPRGDTSASLWLRCHDLHFFPKQQADLIARMSGDNRIRLFDADNRLSLPAFYAAIDIYLTPSRAEGYGLNLVEAASAGIPVITSSWRLAPEIATMPFVHLVGYDLIPVVDPQSQYANVPDARWAEPRRDEIVAQIRALIAAKK